MTTTSGKLLTDQRLAEIEQDYRGGGNDFAECAEGYVAELLAHVRALDWRNYVTVLANLEAIGTLAAQCLADYRPHVSLMMPHTLPYHVLEWKFHDDGTCAAKCGELVVSCHQWTHGGPYHVQIAVGANQALCFVSESGVTTLAESQEYALKLLAAISLKMEAMQEQA